MNYFWDGELVSIKYPDSPPPNNINILAVYQKISLLLNVGLHHLTNGWADSSVLQGFISDIASRP